MKNVYANPYESQNKLQAAYDKLWGGCLCGLTESCGFCDGSMEPAKEAIEEVAKSIGYQLYIHGSPIKG